MKKGTLLLSLFLFSCTKAGGAEEPRPVRTVIGEGDGKANAPAPSDTALLFQQSYDQEAAGKLDASLAAIDALPAATKEGYVAQLRRGWLLYRLGRSPESVAAYTLANAREPGAVESKIGALAPLAVLRRWADIEATAREILKRDPSNYTATIRLAFALYSSAKFSEAEAAYRALAALYPSDVEVKSGLGWSLVKLGKVRDASAVFADILAIAPKNTLALEGFRATNPSATPK